MKSYNGKLILAFAAVYTIWGSTFFGIRIAIETIPPFLMAGIRFAGAGVLLYLWARSRGAKAPTLIEWRSAAIIGAALFFISNGGVSWSELRVPSGITALLVSTVPLWFAIMEWLWHGGARPTRKIVGGLIIGFSGVLILIGPGQLFGQGSIDLLGVGVIMIANFSWATGSLYSRRAKLPSSQLLAAGMQMTAGGVILLIASLVMGEIGRFDPSAVTPRSWLALSYLLVFGSIVGFSAYAWLLRATTPSRLATYAYVNPVIAILLGWGFGGEKLTLQVFAAAGVIILAVVLIMSGRSKSSPKPPPCEGDNVPAAVPLVQEDLA
jgi:drug/metabolite transporter (DMT)-like permease